MIVGRAASSKKFPPMTSGLEEDDKPRESCCLRPRLGLALIPVFCHLEFEHNRPAHFALQRFFFGWGATGLLPLVTHEAKTHPFLPALKEFSRIKKELEEAKQMLLERSPQGNPFF